MMHYLKLKKIVQKGFQLIIGVGRNHFWWILFFIFFVFKKGFYPIVEWFHWDFCENLTKLTHQFSMCIFYTKQSSYLLNLGLVFLHSLHKGLEFRHLLPYCPKSWNMNFWRINVSSWGRNLYEVALWFYEM